MRFKGEERVRGGGERGVNPSPPPDETPEAPLGAPSTCDGLGKRCLACTNVLLQNFPGSPTTRKF